MTTQRSLGLRALLCAGLLAACGDQSTPTDTNTPPIAEAGPDHSVLVGEAATLDGSASSDADGDALTYQWSVVSAPAGSGAVPTDPGAATTTFVPDLHGEFVIELTVSDGQRSASDRMRVVAEVDARLCGTIASDSILRDFGVAYTVTCELVVNAALTIEPGVTLEFGSGTKLTVRDVGLLTAIGTESDSIRLVGADPTPGFWRGIEVHSTTASDLRYVEVAHGGAQPFPQGPFGNIVLFIGGQLRLTNSLLRDGASHGLYVYTPGLDAFSENTFRGNAGPPISIPAQSMGSLDAKSTFAGGNGRDAIIVRGGGVGTDQTWVATDVPYVVASQNVVIRAAVVVEPGVEIRFQEGVNDRLIIADDGTISAVGTPDSLVRFVADNEIPGGWGGIEVRSNSLSNELRWVEVAHGGEQPFPEGPFGNVVVGIGARLKLTNSVLRDAASHGLYVHTSGLEEFAANAFSANAGPPVSIPADAVGSMDAATAFAGGNGRDAILVRGGNVVTDQVWVGTDAPFVVPAQNIVVRAAVVVGPGFELRFQEGVNDRLILAGSFSAVGSPTAPVRILGDEETPGSWGGIEVRSQNNSLIGAEVAYAGGFGNIVINSGGKMSVTGSEIHHAEMYGIYVRLGGQVERSENNNHDNGVGPFFDENQ